MVNTATDVGAKRWDGAQWLIIIFVLSGFAGLIYQSIWTQYLGLLLGHSAHAQSLVLMLFMGGMALGAWGISRYSEVLRKPLMAYAAIELIIGLLGLGFDGIFQVATGWAYADVMPRLDGGALTAFRWSMAAALVLPQCILLGATFPLMSAGYIRTQPHAHGQVLAGLYFSNSLGAACGALASTYLLLPAVGLPGTVMGAGLLNILVAILVYPLAREAVPPVAALLMAGSEVTGNDRRLSSGRETWLILVVAALTGASSFVYEITWVRMLSLALGTTLHSFELMLAAFIAGIAFGGLWLRNRADRMESPLRVAGWVQIWMGLAALASMFIYANSFEWVGWMMRVLVRSVEGYGLYNFASGAIAALVMFPAAFFAGMTLPLLTLSLLRAGRGERSIGQAYAFNTVGAIVGVLMAVHLLMPFVGLKYALIVAATVDLILGLALIFHASPSGSRVWTASLSKAAAVGAIGLILAISVIHFDPLVLSSSVYRHGSTRLAESTKMLFYRDGQTATVSVYEALRNGAKIRSIATNGKVDAGMTTSFEMEPSSDESTMILLGAIPLALKEGYERVGVIGFGSGLTTHTLLGDSRVGQVDTVEIEPAMVEGAHLFGARVARAFDDPRSHVVIDDAKAYFAASPRKYDLIISEPSNPWVGGTAALFSDEFYEFVPKQLNDGGVFVQWLQLYEITPELVSSVLVGMLEQFSDVRAYLANNGDLILVAVPEGEVPEFNSGVFSQEALSRDLARIGVHEMTDLQDTFVMDNAALQAFVPLYPASRNSDYFPSLKLKAPVARFKQAYTGDFESFTTAAWPMIPTIAREDKRGVKDQRLPLLLISKRSQAVTIDRLISGVPSPTGYSYQNVQAEALKGISARCELDAHPQLAVSLIFELAKETIPYLPQEARSRLWRDRRWIDCEARTPSVVDALGLAGAAAVGEHEQVLLHGQRLFDDVDGAGVLLDDTASYYVFGAMQHAAWSMGDGARAQMLLDKYWDQLGEEARRDGTLRLLTTMAVRAKPPRSSESGSATDVDRL